MTLSELQKDMSTMAFNDGQLNLIANLRTSHFDNVDDFMRFLYTWESMLVRDQKKIGKKYQGLKQ
jgi:hypothetical protein